MATKFSIFEIDTIDDLEMSIIVNIVYSPYRVLDITIAKCHVRMSCHRYIFHISLPIPERATSLYSYSNAPHRSSITDLPSPRPRPRRSPGTSPSQILSPRCRRMRGDAIECDAPAPTSMRSNAMRRSRSHVINQILPDSMNTASSNWLHHETHILSFVASPRRRRQRHPGRDEPIICAR